MFTTVDYADITVAFHFSNGTTLSLIVNPDESNDDSQEIESLEINTALSASTSNPLGSVASSTLEITVSSFNNYLNPNNVNSPYYGYMDRTCYIEVSASKLYIDVDDEQDPNATREQTLVSPALLGTYFVSDWVGMDSSDDVNGVRISATDLISTIGNMEVPIVTLDTTQGMLSYITNVIAGLNAKLPAYKQIALAQGTTLGVFDRQLRYRNIKTDGKFIDLLNQVSHCLLCNIYMSNDNKLTFDSMIDDVGETPVYAMSDETNLESVRVENGLLVDYAGASISYPIDRTGPNMNVGSIEETTFDDTSFTNFHFSGGVYKLAYMVITSTSDVCPTISTMKHDNMEMDLALTYQGNPGQDDTYSIGMGGALQESGYLSTAAAADDSVCEIENDLLQKANIPQYLAAVNAYMQNKRSGVSCDGWFDPRLSLGDVVTVESTLLGVSKNYKVTSLNWRMDSNFSCHAELRSITDYGEVA